MSALGLLQNIVRERRRQVAMPRFLTFIVTFTCNARCIMCDSWKKPSPDDLSVAEIENIFEQLPRMDAVRLTGGEPFVRRDLPQIAKLVQHKLQPVALHITTNGFLTDRIVEFCETREKTTPLQLLISVDGLRSKHNHVRGRDSAWDSVMRTISALAPRRDELRLNIAVNQTIVDAQGASDYPKLRDHLAQWGVKNQVVMAYDASATYSVEDEVEVAPGEVGSFATFGDFNEQQIIELLDEVERDIESYPPAERAANRYYLRGIRNRLLHCKGAPNPPCVALGSHMRLFPNGDVPTCQFNTRKVGNLRRQLFEQVWFGEDIEPQRRWVRNCPGCWAECEVLPSALYTGDLFAHGL